MKILRNQSQLAVDQELRSICESILAEGKSAVEWDRVESDDLVSNCGVMRRQVRTAAYRFTTQLIRSVAVRMPRPGMGLPRDLRFSARQDFTMLGALPAAAVKLGNGVFSPFCRCTGTRNVMGPLSSFVRRLGYRILRRRRNE
jgi:hypothetical protein